MMLILTFRLNSLFLKLKCQKCPLWKNNKIFFYDLVSAKRFPQKMITQHARNDLNRMVMEVH